MTKQKQSIRTFIGYQSYTFHDHDPAIDKIRTLIADHGGMQYVDIARRSGVTVQTLSNWFAGRVRKPQHATLEAVARVFGFSFDLVATPTVEVQRQETARNNVVNLAKYQGARKRKEIKRKRIAMRG